jgi:hypothetical protein
LLDYFSTNQEKKTQAQIKIKHYLSKNAALLENLQKALKDPKSHSLHEMGVFFRKFNLWSNDYVKDLTEQEKQKMVGFREAMASLLLTDQPSQEKQKKLEALAKQHFKSKVSGLICLADVLLAIITLFIPYLITGHSFFSGRQTQYQKAVQDWTQTIEHWSSAPHSEDAPDTTIASDGTFKKP